MEKKKRKVPKETSVPMYVDRILAKKLRENEEGEGVKWNQRQQNQDCIEN